MRDYYAEFLNGDSSFESSESQLTKLTEEAPFAFESTSVGFVSSFSDKPEKEERTVERILDTPIVTERSPVRRVVVGQAGGRDYVICECGKHAFAGHNCPYCGAAASGVEADENAIIEAVQEFLKVGSAPVEESVAIAAYKEKLAVVRSDPKLEAVPQDICEERKAILILDGGMSEQDAEANVSDIQFLTEALIMT